MTPPGKPLTEAEKVQLIKHAEILTGDLVYAMDHAAIEGIQALNKLEINNLIFFSFRHAADTEYLYYDVAKETELYEFSVEKVQRMAYEVSGEKDWELEGGDTQLNKQTKSYETTLAFGIGGPFSYEDMTVSLSDNDKTLSASFDLRPGMIAEGDEGWEEYGRYRVDYKVLREDDRLFLRFDSLSKENAEPPATSESTDGLLGQPDPTLRENQSGSFYRWDNIEYKRFGDISTYQDIPLELHDYLAENAGQQAERLSATMRLPQCCLMDNESGVIDYDGDFANGTIKIGGAPTEYYILRDGETIKENGNEALSYVAFTVNVFSGERFNMVETQENQIGGYYQTEKFMRYVGEGMGLGANASHLLQYVIEPKDGILTSMYFFVSTSATAGDLEIYDAIANSVMIQ